MKQEQPVSKLLLTEINALLDERLLLIQFLESKNLLFEFMDWRDSKRLVKKNADT